MSVRYAYLHGFASSPRAFKGTQLAERFRAHGLTLLQPDLNLPSFRKLTYTAMVEHVRGLMADAPDVRWRFIGSSLGGFVAARVAELEPGRVDRLLLLCPGFDMITRWPEMLGEDAFMLWKKNGAFFFPDADGEPQPVSYDLIEDARQHPPYPNVSCPTWIVHGRADDVVPIDQSREYSTPRPHVQLIEVDDDHGLTSSIETIAAIAANELIGSGAAREEHE